MSKRTWGGPVRGVVALFCAVGLTALISACGGGSDGGGGTPPTASPSTGVFIDSPVQGLGYSCAPSGLSGLTNANGQYNFLPGDTATFTLYGRPIGAAVPAGPVVTALSVFSATSLTDPQVLNLSQLLLTLAGGSPATGNPIVVPPTPPAGFPATIDFSAANFDTSFPGLTLVSEATATTHLQGSFKTVSVTVVNSGTVTSNPAGINCTAGTCTAVFQTGADVTLTATGTGFTGWSGGTGSAGCTGAGTCAVTLNADSTVTATFPVAPPPATVTILPNGGTGVGSITCSANGGAFGPCAASYPNPTPLVIRAAANSGSTFTGWTDGTGNATTCNGTTVDCSMTLTADSAIRANFTLPVLNSVTATTATTNGGGGTVTCTANGGAPGPCASYTVGTAIVMTATPNGVSNFTGWSGGTGNATACNGTTTTCAFTLTGNTTMTANFNRPTLSVTVVGAGSVSSNLAGINNCTTSCTAPFDKGTSVTLTAGAGLTGWSGGGCSGTGTCVVTLNADTTVTATFGVVTGDSIYQFTWADDGPLLAIDPANPTATPITVANNVVWAEKAKVSATYDAATQTANNVRWESLIYASGGKLFKINMQKSAGVPGSAANPPVQVSNETGATKVCDINPIVSPVGPGRVTYRLPGANGFCFQAALPGNDDVQKMISLSATATDAPTAFPPGLIHVGEQVFNLTTGAASHIFFTDEANSNTLKVLNLTTNSTTTVQANVGTSDQISFVAQDTSDRVFLVGNQTLYLYTISTNVLTALKTGTSPMRCSGSTCADGTHLYVYEDAGKVYRAPLTATGPADVQTILNGTTPILQVQLTTNRVLVVTHSGTTTVDSALLSVAKTGGAPTTVVPSAPNNFIPFMFTKDNFAFYSLRQSILPSGSSVARIIQEDGTQLASNPGEWISAKFRTSVSLRNQSPDFEKLVSLNGPVSTGTTVSLYDAAAPTTTPTVPLGALQATPNPFDVVFPGFGFESGQILIGSPQMINPITSVLFVDLAVPNSLVLVPTTPNGWQPLF